MKTKISYTIILCVFLFLILTQTAKYLSPNTSEFVGYLTAFYEISFDIAIVILLLKVWSISRKPQVLVQTSPVIPPLLIGVFSLLIGDVIYNYLINVKAVSNVRGTLLELAYNVPYMFFLWASAVTFGMLSKLSHGPAFFIGNCVATLLSIIVLTMFVPIMVLEELPKINFYTHILCMVAKSYIIAHACLHLLFGSGKPSRFLAAGFLTILSYSLVLEFIEVYGLLSQGLVTEFFWVAGQSLIFLSIYNYKILQQEQLKNTQKSDGALRFNTLESRILFVGCLVTALSSCGFLLLKSYWQQFPNLPNGAMILSYFMFLVVCLFGFSLYIRSFLTYPLRSLFSSLSSGALSANIQMTSNTGVYELDLISTQIVSLFRKVQNQHQEQISLVQLARRVSHDIRSPLAALKVLLHGTDSLPEEQRDLIKTVSSRIQHIADTLLEVKQNVDTPQVEQLGVTHLFGAIETLIAEKRVSVSGHFPIELSLLGNTHECWISIPRAVFLRSLSNIIDNSIEALRSNPTLTNPRIFIGLVTTNGSSVRVTVQDNGGGVPQEVVESVAQGKSKSTKPHGNGIGLTQANSMANTHGGRLEIFTQEGCGSIVSLLLPCIPVPEAISYQVQASPGQMIVVVDDDRVIHSVWKQKLKGFMPELQLKHFYRVSEVLTELPEIPEGQALFLVDYEFRDESISVSDLISSCVKHGHECQLVTSHYENMQVLSLAKQLGVQVIPKSILQYVQVIQKSVPEIQSVAPGLRFSTVKNNSTLAVAKRAPL